MLLFLLEKSSASGADIWGENEVQEYSIFADQSDTRPQPK